MTFEILDRSEAREGKELRVVSAAEIHAVTLVEQTETEDPSTPRTDVDETGAQNTPKSNVNTHDDPTNQKLTMAEIEALKQDDMGSGRELIEKIMQSHSTLDQKTSFSLAKYTLRKHKKYMKRFTVLPLDVPMLADYMFDVREASKIMELRNESIGLIGCWANVHADGQDSALFADYGPSSRYLVVDDTGGLVVAALAERMSILHQTNLAEVVRVSLEEEDADGETEQAGVIVPQRAKGQRYRASAMSAKSNTITMIHANQQPNLGLLRYFNFDFNNPTPSHSLYTNLKTVSWLQLLDPEADTTYREPETLPPDELSKLKSNRRSAYYRKRRRWERVKSVVDETRAGGFNGLVVATYTDPVSILRQLVPLLAGGSQVVVYSPTVEPLVELADYYSTARRTAFINTPAEKRGVPSDDFPVDPTQLLPPTVQTARVRKWQVLPGRTHPLMTGRGGAEGYLFVGTRVLPAEGKVEARGRPPRSKKTKTEESNGATENEGPLGSPLKKQKIEQQDTQPDVETPVQVSKETSDVDVNMET